MSFNQSSKDTNSAIWTALATETTARETADTAEVTNRNTAISTHNSDGSAHSDIRTTLSTKASSSTVTQMASTLLSALTDISTLQSTVATKAAIAGQEFTGAITSSTAIISPTDNQYITKKWVADNVDSLITVDNNLDIDSEYPVQNKIITTAINDALAEIDTKATDTAVIHNTSNESYSGRKVASVVTISGTTGTSSTPVTMPVIDPSLGNSFKAVLEYVTGVISFNMSNLVQGQKFTVYVETVTGCNVAWDNALNIVWDNVYEPTIAESRGIFIADFIYMVDSEGNGKLHGKIIRNNKKSYADFPNYVLFYSDNSFSLNTYNYTYNSSRTGSYREKRKGWAAIVNGAVVDGVMQYANSVDANGELVWQIWDYPTTTTTDPDTNETTTTTSTALNDLSSFVHNGRNELYLRGGSAETGSNTTITSLAGTADPFSFKFTVDNNGKIYSYGRLDSLKYYDISNIDTTHQVAYYSLFRECTNLVSAPELPETVLLNGHYNRLFYGCSSLKEPPALPFTGNILSSAYKEMFRACTALEKIPAIKFSNIGHTNALDLMFYGCSKVKISNVASENYHNFFFYASKNKTYIYTFDKIFFGTTGEYQGTYIVEGTDEHYYTYSDTPYYTSNEVVYPYDEVPTTLEERVETLETGVVHNTGDETIAGVKTFSSGTTDFFPATTITYDLGSNTKRWKDIYNQNGVISSSDQRLKQDIATIPDAVLDAWGDVNWKQYKFKTSVTEKGDSARLHTGAIAQQIDSVFSSHGLDASKYGLFCHDSWEAKAAVYEEIVVEDSPAEYDDEGNIISEAVTHTEQVEVEPARPAGDAYSLRYEECLVMEAQYQRRRADRLETRIQAIESKLGI